MEGTRIVVEEVDSVRIAPSARQQPEYSQHSQHPARRTMGDSWALPAGGWGASAARTKPIREHALARVADIGLEFEDADAEGGSYPDDTQRGVDSTSLTGTKDDYDPYTGVLGTAGTPVTCGYGGSGSTIGIGYTETRSRWDEGRYRGATPFSYAYEHGGNPEPVRSARQSKTAPASISAHAPAASLSHSPSHAPVSRLSFLRRLLAEVGAIA